MQLRNAEEFGFEVGAFHHAHEAYLVPELFKNNPNNITIAIFADLWGYKSEAFHSSPYAGKILTDAGVPVAYKSDHFVTNSQHLLYQPQFATHFNLSDQNAIKSLTSVPAESLGLGHRLGYIRSGYDADLVLWNTYPLELGAHPIQVFIDGKPQLDFLHETLHEPFDPQAKLKTNTPSPASMDFSNMSCSDDSSISLIVRGIQADYRKASARTQTGESFTLVLHAGKVTCLGSSATCAPMVQVASDAGAKEAHLQGSTIVPGAVALAPNIGLGEIDAEETTQNGRVDQSKILDPSALVSAANGLVLGGPHLDRASKMGISVAIVAPGKSASAPSFDGQFLQGISAAFRPSAKSVLDAKTFVKKQAALHLMVGLTSKGEVGTGTESFSAQIQTLRTLLSTNEQQNNTYGQIVSGQLPLVIEANKKDEIAHLILVKREFPKVDLVLKGAIEAYLLAKELADTKIPLLIYPRCMPQFWNMAECLPGPPLTDDTNLSILLDHGVKVGLVANDDGNIGSLLFEAAWAAALVNENSDNTGTMNDGSHGAKMRRVRLDTQETINLVSQNVRDILRLPEPERNDFVLLAGNPLDIKAQIALIVEDGNVIHCAPRIE